MKEHHGFLFGILSALSSAIMSVFVKLATDVPDATLIFFRFLIGLGCLLPFVLKKKIRFSLRSVPKHLSRGLCGLGGVAFYIMAIKLTTLVDAVALWNTAPLFVPVVLLVWLKLLVPKKRFIAGAVGFVGVLIILQPTHLLQQTGNLLALAAGVCSAFAWVGIRQLSKSESTETILLYYFVISVVVLLIPMTVTWRLITNWLDWVYILCVGIFSYLNQYFLTKSFTHAPASKVSAVNYLTVIFGALAGWWLFGEAVTFWVFVGTSLIVLGGIWTLFDKSEPVKL